MRILTYILFLLFSLGQLGRISFLDQQINIYLYEVFALIIVLVQLAGSGFRPIANSWKRLKSIYIFSITLILSFLFSLQKFNFVENVVAFLYLGRLLFYFLFFIYMLHYLRGKNKERKSMQQAILLFIILTALFSAIQYFLYPNLRNLAYLGWDPHHYRVFGLFFDTSTTVGICGLTILYLLKKYANRLNQLLLINFSILGLLSFARGFYISIFTTITVYLILLKKYIAIALFGTVFVALLFIIPKPGGEGVNLARTFTIDARIADYKKGFDIWSKSPILGIGYNHIRAVKGEEQSHAGGAFHSSFLLILVTTGVIGLISFIFVLFELVKSSKMAGYYILFLSIFSLFDNIILQPFILFFLFCLLTIEFTASRTLS